MQKNCLRSSKRQEINQTLRKATFGPNFLQIRETTKKQGKWREQSVEIVKSSKK